MEPQMKHCIRRLGTTSHPVVQCLYLRQMMILQLLKYGARIWELPKNRRPYSRLVKLLLTGHS